MTLQELTDQEAGIIVFQDKSVALGDWASLAEEHLLDWTEEPGWADGCEEQECDLREFIPGRLWVEKVLDGERERFVEKCNINFVFVKNPKGFDWTDFYHAYDYDVCANMFTLANGIVIIAPFAWA